MGRGRVGVEELAARHLARVGAPMTIDALAAAIGHKGYDVSAAELKAATGRHPAFRTKNGAPPVIGIGRPAAGPPAAAYLKASQAIAEATHGRPHLYPAGDAA